jgi:hypothetical protein
MIQHKNLSQSDESMIHIGTPRTGRSLRGACTALIAGFCGVMLSGCAMQNTTASGPVALPSTIRGVMHGGQNPVYGATIQLYQAGTSGYSSAATALGSSVTTASDGSFTFNNLATSPESSCTSSSSLVYIVATGGVSTTNQNPSTYNNPQISMMAALGACGNLGSSTNIVINELTTVAAVAALGPFMSGYTHVGTSSTNVAGLTQAFTTAAGLVNTTSGAAPGTFSGTFPSAEVVTVPIAEMDSLANSLAACVNISGVSGGAAAAKAGDGTACGKLLTAATPPGSSTSPTEVVGAALNILQYPTNAVAAVYNQGVSGAPFQPTLSSAPADWSVPVTFTSATAGWISSPWHLALDSSGDVWIANYGCSCVTETTSTGAWLSTTAGSGGYRPTSTGGTNSATISPALSSASGIAIDLSGNAWVTYYGGKQTVELSNSGQFLRQFVETSAAANSEAGVAIDETGDVWVSNKANSTISVINTSTLSSTSANTQGNAYSTSFTSLTGNSLSSAEFMAIDASHQMWVTNDNYSSSNSPKLSVFDITEGSSASASIPTGYPKTTNTSTTGSAGFDTGVAIDANGNAWIASSGLTNTSGAYVSGYSTVDEFSSTGTLVSPGTGYFMSGWVAPREVAVDGNNNIWVTVCGYGNAPCNTATETTPSVANLGGYITMISGSSTSSSYSYSTPIAASYLAGPASLAIDNAGSIWVANSGATAAQTGGSAINAYLTEIVGVAAPVAIPMVQALKNSVSNGANTVGSIGNRP